MYDNLSFHVDEWDTLRPQVTVSLIEKAMASSLASGPESHSPSSSPRLPSPPPFPEVQIHSSTSGVQGSRTSQDAVETAKLDYAASRRIRPGTKAADMASGPPLVPLSEVCLHRDQSTQGGSIN